MSKLKNRGGKVKVISVIIMLIFSMSAIGLFFITEPLANADEGDLCPAKTDVILIIDKSESMGHGSSDSLCEWEIKEEWGVGFVCMPYDDSMVEKLSESECLAKQNYEDCNAPVYTSATLSKIEAAKEANKNFVDKLGNNDQSGLISFIGEANLDKSLDSEHGNTKNAINILSIGDEATNIAHAIETAISDFDNNSSARSVKVVIVLTDGQDNNSSIAQAQADIAKEKGYKIFTIGLGNGVDADALNLIAETTDAKYYPASDQNELNNIYDLIAEDICNYSSISGCKYLDADNNGDIVDENIIDGWEIILSGEASNSQLTDEFGCYEFNGLLPGNYIISEGGKDGVIFEQTYPTENNGEYTFTLLESESTTTIDFGNYLPYCGNGIEDTDYDGYDDEQCDTTEPIECETDDGYQGLQNCVSCVLGSCEPTESCGDEIKNGDEECDGDDGVGENQHCTTQCLLEENTECEDGETRNCYSGADGTVGFGVCVAGIQTCVEGVWAEECVGEITPTDEICGNEIDEDCDGNIQECEQEENTGGNSPSGGGGSIPSLYIHSEGVLETGVDNTLIKWHTNKPATSRVVYDVSPVNPLGSWPNLGYANSTIENPEKITFHEVTISGLLSNTLYYFRTISSASPEIFSEEFSFTTAQAGEEEQDNEEENTEGENQDDPADDEEETNDEEKQTTENQEGSEKNEEEDSNTDSEENENSQTQEDEGQVLGESVMSQALD
ncbi:VWA domain-containing protein, partial [bacterium]|nr:VWA domain-containing protein [bacterium]